MNLYVCFWKGKQFEVLAKTTYEAQKICAEKNKIKKSYEITVMLSEKEGVSVTHKPIF